MARCGDSFGAFGRPEALSGTAAAANEDDDLEARQMLLLPPLEPLRVVEPWREEQRAYDGRCDELDEAEDEWRRAVPSAASRRIRHVVCWLPVALSVVVVALFATGIFSGSSFREFQFLRGADARSSLLEEAATEGWQAEDKIEATRIDDKPIGDVRSYQYATLQNGLQVLNVLDPTATLTGFAMAVQAGSFDDPIELPGLAHFCEHMLFLGTKRFPTPDGFDNFLAKHEGSTNAYTADEVTVYHGEVTSEALSEAYRRFADFFSEPTFNRKYVMKEVHAIDSEHKKNVQDPLWQVLEVLGALADPASPVSRFHTGDIGTLHDEPMRKGIDPVTALKAYFKAHYCPVHMRLVTISAQSLEEQLKESIAIFGTAPAGSKECQGPVPRFDSPSPFPPERMAKFVAIRGMQPKATLTLHFEMPSSVLGAYRSQPLAYLDHVISYGGAGSFRELVTTTFGLLTGLATFVDMGTSGTRYYISADLTENGRDHLVSILDIFFAYVASLKREAFRDPKKPQVNSTLLNSIADLSRLDWDWQEPLGMEDMSMGFAETMTMVPVDQVLTAYSRMDKPDPEEAARCLALLAPRNMNVAYMSQQEGTDKADFFEGGEQHTLPHYDGLQYSVQELADLMPDSFRRWEQWIDLQSDSAALARELSSVLKSSSLEPPADVLPVLPPPVTAVPKDVSRAHMRAKDRCSPGTCPVYGPPPTKIPISTSSMTASAPDMPLWYRGGWVSMSPRASIEVRFRRLHPSRGGVPLKWSVTALDDLKLQVWKALFDEESGPRLFDHSYTADWSVTASSESLSFMFTGFAEGLPQLISAVLQEFDRFNKAADQVDPVKYRRALDNIQEGLRVHDGMPVEYAIEDLDILLNRDRWARSEYLEAMKKMVTTASATAVSDLLLSSKLQVTALAMGNVEQKAALNSATEIASLLLERNRVGSAMTSQEEDDKVEEEAFMKVWPVPDFSTPIEVRSQNPRPGDPNDVAVVALVKNVTTVESWALMSIAAEIFHQVLYGELRTQKQLGYVVEGAYRPAQNVDVLIALVQGTVVSADQAEDEIDRVLWQVMPGVLQNLSQADFDTQKEALAEKLLQTPQRASDEFTHFEDIVMRLNFSCDVDSRMLAVLRSPATSRDALVQLWSELLEEGKRITVKYFAKETPPSLADQASKIMALRQTGMSQALASQAAASRSGAQVLERATAEARERLAAKSGEFPANIVCAPKR